MLMNTKIDYSKINKDGDSIASKEGSDSLNSSQITNIKYSNYINLIKLTDIIPDLEKLIGVIRIEDYYQLYFKKVIY